MKPHWDASLPRRHGMPPTRGHDLKLNGHAVHIGGHVMPPTRGHDLKLRRT